MGYNLLKSLNSKNDNQESKKEDFSAQVKYQQYTIENKYEQKFIVKIPIREVSNFENKISQLEDITYEDINLILRKFRGILID